MPRKPQSDPKADALANRVGGGEEANDKDQDDAGPTVEDTETSPEEDEDTTSQDEVVKESPQEESDPKADALKALVTGGGTKEVLGAPSPAVANPVRATGKAVKIGTGKSKALVAADKYVGQDDQGNPIVAGKGDTVVLSSEKVDRGVRLGLLVKP